MMRAKRLAGLVPDRPDSGVAFLPDLDPEDPLRHRHRYPLAALNQHSFPNEGRSLWLSSWQEDDICKPGVAKERITIVEFRLRRAAYLL